MDDAEAVVGGVEVEGGKTWCNFTAEALSKTAAALIGEYLSGKVANYLVEWCETPERCKPGVVYQDTCVLYTDKADEVLKYVGFGADQDVFVYIDRPLLDPVLDEACADIESFLQSVLLVQQ